MASQTEEITGVFIRETHRWDDVCIAEFRYSNGTGIPSLVPVKLQADFDELRLHSTYRLYGSWSEYQNKRLGTTVQQFHAKTFIRSAPHGKEGIIRYLVEREIPVCAHLGLTPQSVLRLGGFKIQGRSDAARQLVEDARAVAAAGASIMVLECVPTPVAAEVTAAVDVPTIGIGAGPQCDGQVLVLHDFLGLDSGHRRPKFVKDFLAEGGSVAGATRAFADAVRDGSFPDEQHAYAQ